MKLVFLLTVLRLLSLALQQNAHESGPWGTHSVLPSQGAVLRHPELGAARSCPVSPCTLCSPLLCQPSEQPDAPRAALLCAAWLPACRTPSEPCFVTYPHFMFSCAQLVPLPAFLPRTVLSHFKYKPRALVCMQLKSRLAFFLLLSLLSTLLFFFFVFMSHSGPPTILTTFNIGTASSH